jgi:hypothetical protein
MSLTDSTTVAEFLREHPRVVSALTTLILLMQVGIAAAGDECAHCTGP